MKLGRILLSLVVLGLGAVWVAPAVLFTLAAPDLAKQNGMGLAMQGTLPALPIGFEVDRLDLDVKGDAWSIRNAAVRLYPSGWNVQGEVASGFVDANLPLDAQSGWVRFHELALDELPLDLPSGVMLRGHASGAATWQPDDFAISARVLQGSIAMMLLPVAFEAVDVVAHRRADREVEVTSLSITGPDLEAAGSGRVDAQGEVALVLDLLHLGEGLTSLAQMLDAAPNRIPTRYSIEGRLPRPQVREIPLPSRAPADDFDDPF